MEQVNLKTIHNDLEFLKKAVAEIKVAVNIEPALKDEVVQKVKDARERISEGKFLSNEEVLKEFNIK